MGKYAKMGDSEQVLGTHEFANVRGVFFMPNNCIPVRRKVRRSSIMLGGTPALAKWVPSLDERRTLRVRQQENCSMAHITGNEGGYIYIARYVDTWKIGCTREGSGYVSHRNTHGDLGGVHARLWSLRKKTGADWQLVHVMYAPKNVMQVEHDLHSMCDNFRCSSLELFALPDEMFNFIKSRNTFAGNAVSHLEVA